MDVRKTFARFATAGAHVLVVEAPGWWTVHVAVEQALLSHGWRAATSPADADVLLVCGKPARSLAEAVERVWDQMPGPRARVVVADAQAARAALTQAAGLLADEDRQRADARTRPLTPTTGDMGEQGDTGDDHGGMHNGGHGGMEHGGHGGMEHGGMDHGGMDHGGMDHGGMDHGGMDHGGMQMAPAGIPLAGGGPDRDGLDLDVLHVPLGPVLPHWPAGLVLRCALQGDVVTQATAEVLDSAAVGAPPPGVAAVRAARRCDSAARVLAVAGWDDAAAAARRTRDELLAGGRSATSEARLDRLTSRVGRSWALRWLLRGLGSLDDTAVARLGLPASAAGDVHDRLMSILRRARADLRGEPVDDAADPAATLRSLPALLTGLELAAVRLVVASLDPDTAALQRVAAHG